jgi:DNA end-binding protein Ku
MLGEPFPFCGCIGKICRQSLRTFAVIRETIRHMEKVAVGRVVLTSREHIIGLEPLGKRLMGMLLREPYEVREMNEYRRRRGHERHEEHARCGQAHRQSEVGDFDPSSFEEQRRCRTS